MTNILTIITTILALMTTIFTIRTTILTILITAWTLIATILTIRTTTVTISNEIFQNAVQDDVSYSEAAKSGVDFTCVDTITDEEASSIVSDDTVEMLFFEKEKSDINLFYDCCVIGVCI